MMTFCVFWPTFVILGSIQWKVEEEIPSKYHGLSVNGLRKHDQKESLSSYVQVFLRIPLAWKEKYNKHATVYMFSYHVDGPARISMNKLEICRPRTSSDN